MAAKNMRHPKRSRRALAAAAAAAAAVDTFTPTLTGMSLHTLVHAADFLTARELGAVDAVAGLFHDRGVVVVEGEAEYRGVIPATCWRRAGRVLGAAGRERMGLPAESAASAAAEMADV